MLGNNVIKLFFQFKHFSQIDFHITRNSLCAATRLVNHHSGMLQSRTLSFFTRNQKHRSHRSRHTCTNRSYIRLDNLHRVINSQSSINTSTRRIDINLNILARVSTFQKQQLCRHDIRHLVINSCSQKDDSIHHQS